MSTPLKFMKLTKILKKLGIHDAQNYMHNVILDGIDIDKIVSINFDGGMLEEKNETKKITIKYKNNDFSFSSYHEKNNIYYHLEENGAKCITVIINSSEQNAKIYEVNYDPLCFPKKIKEEYKSGTTLLNVALKLIEKIKNKYDLKYMSLQDNSTKICYNIGGNKIKFSKMIVLISGDTWYGKYGFLPYDTESDEGTKLLVEKYKKNKKIMNIKKMRDVKNLDKLFYNAVEKSNLVKTLEKNVIDLYENYKKENMLVKDFVNDLLDKKLFLGDKKRKISGTCVVFYYLYEKLYDELGLHDFSKKSFIRKI